MSKLRASATAAAARCTGNRSNTECHGYRIGKITFNQGGAGEQMSALAAVQVLLIETGRGSVTLRTCGTSKSSLNAGYRECTTMEYGRLTTASTAVAIILSALAILSTVRGARWLLAETSKGPGYLSRCTELAIEVGGRTASLCHVDRID